MNTNYINKFQRDGDVLHDRGGYDLPMRSRAEKQEERIPKENWTQEEYKARIKTVDHDIASYCKALNDIDSKINQLKEEKKVFQRKIGKKVVYKQLLTKHIFDLIPDIPDRQSEERFPKLNRDKDDERSVAENA